jgi:hypothetical protein
MKKIIFLSCLFLASGAAHAAQSGKVIVDSAVVHEFPQAESKPLDQVTKDTVVAVSNLPTEGFYKVRTQSGVVGWISGNDVFIAGANTNAPVVSSPPANRPEIPGSHSPNHKKKRYDDDFASDDSDQKPKVFKDDYRILFMGGLHNLNYGDLPSKFSTAPYNFGLSANDLNLGVGFTFEVQKKMKPGLHVALRLEYLTTSAPEKTLSGGTTTLDVKNAIIPLSVGFVWSPIDHQGFRLGFGGYLGGSFASTTLHDSAIAQDVKYSSLDPTATLVLQGSIGLTRLLALAYELGYRYELPGTTPVSENFGAGFKVNYSGYFARLGLEIRF